MTTNLLGSGQVGRYFTVVSVLPSAVLVLYIYLLAGTDPWSGPLQWSELADFRAQNLVITGIAVMVLALALNPLQFTLIQLMEGYWGNSRLAVQFATIRTIYHQRRAAELDGRALADDAPGAGMVERTRATIDATESERLFASYPVEQRDFLPTRLGNVLRRYETTVGKPYGLDPLLSIPRLAMVVGQRELGYVRDQRVQLELAIRTALLAGAAVVATVVLLWRQGLWMLLAAVPYGVAFLAYRGAVAIAHEYGTSLAVLTEFGRFDLYRRLHLPHPPDTSAEREVNEKLMRMFDFADETLRYQEPPAPEGSLTPQDGADTNPPETD
ncbi:MAG TPA: hypothetical protein VGR06_18540 [Actinophytocola sp.]|jgi:hypothetical protein|uniref:hypothetical protein n=1 Tax=Actinophytocola sp. TaxID=1872138 RepID=UPI002E06ABBD|nr:hypothetical protein [Actinophytocola sp.]